MSPTLAFILALLATHTGLKVEVQLDKDAVKQMQEREEYLHQEMTRLLQEMDETNSMKETLLRSAQRLLWLPWATELVLLTVAYRLIRRWKRGHASCRQLEGPRRKERVNSEKKFRSQEKITEQDEKQDVPSLEVLKELLEDLLGVCRALSRRNFMPELHPATGTDTSSEAWSVQENSTAYRPLLILRPPPGHSFSVDSTQQLLAGRIRVALECLCSREPLLGQTCFLHASGGQLPRDQCWYLLDTLCTGSYLNVEKVSLWVQMLVASAWLLLPHSLHCQLTALPCGKSCSFQPTGTSGLQISLEMALAVQQGSSGAYLSLE